MKTTPKPFVFVIMPFSKEFDDVYHVAIKDACTAAGAYCERLDEQIFDESMLERIYNQIAKADVLIGDMSGRNPNVFYEVGYAHALGKRVILITQNADDIPFDLKHHFHIVYGGSIGDLRTELSRRIKWYAENPADTQSELLTELQLFLEGEPLVSGLQVSVRPQFHYGTTRVRSMTVPFPMTEFILLQFAAHNPATKAIATVQFNPLLITDDRFPRSGLTEEGSVTVYDVVKMPNGKMGHRPLSSCTVEPGGWSSFRVELYPKERHSELVTLQCTLRILSDGPAVDFPFMVKVATGDDGKKSNNASEATSDPAPGAGSSAPQG